MYGLTKRFLREEWGVNSLENIVLVAWIVGLIIAVVVTNTAPI